MADFDFEKLGDDLPEGTRPGASTSAVAVGKILGVDPAGARVQVSVGGSDPLWVPAANDIYQQGTLARLIRSPQDGGRVTACLGPLNPGPAIVVGVVKAVNSGSGTLTVRVLGADSSLPFVAGKYPVGTSVHVLRGHFGAPMIVLGPQGSFAGADPVQPGGGTGNAPQLVQRQTVILPVWTGSYRGGYGWDRWNTDRYGGRSSLWQGNDWGSGPMTGLAVYGDQIKNLRAETISRIKVVAYRADSSWADARALTVQPSMHEARPDGAPSGLGATTTSPALAPGAGVQFDLTPSVLEGFRDGGYKSLISVGGSYAAFAAPPTRADGMALIVDYGVRE